MIVKSVLACAGCAVFSEKQECAKCNNNINKEENTVKSIFGTQVELRVVNIRTYVPKPNERFIRVDRKSPLGNPFYMRDESMRDEVCNKYRAYFYKKVNERDPLIMGALQEIIDVLKSDTPVALACWCAPKRCHGETILEYIKLQMKEWD